tara:strand:+ start:301 stop:1008 length:708 start_codon:yes stop_codon:yes gene_type:complete
MLAGDKPFRTITKRNAFNLGAGPRLANPAAKPAVEKPTDIKLTGIFKRNGVERAAIAVLKPSDKFAKPRFLQLARGEEREAIRVETIDRKNGTVTLTVNGKQRELNFKDDAYSSTVTKANRSGVSSNRSTPRREPEKKEKKEKKSDAEKLAKINESLARGKISQTSAELKAAVIKGELSGERANLASMLENGLIDNRSYEALSRLDNKSLKASLSELKQARKLDKGKAPKEKKKK